MRRYRIINWRGRICGKIEEDHNVTSLKFYLGHQGYSAKKVGAEVASVRFGARLQEALMDYLRRNGYTIEPVRWGGMTAANTGSGAIKKRREDYAFAGADFKKACYCEKCGRKVSRSSGSWFQCGVTKYPHTKKNAGLATWCSEKCFEEAKEGEGQTENTKDFE